MATENIKRFKIEGFPLILKIIERLDLRKTLSNHFRCHGNEKIPVVDTLIIIICNIVTGRCPLYELKEWVNKIHPHCFSLENIDLSIFNDDRFGRAIEKACDIDRASIISEVSVNAVKNFAVNLDQFHNDSTTIKAFGKIPGKSSRGLELKRGKSKDHRPDLKQLLYSLTITSDGAVPIHYKTYPGNRSDDSTHIETWNSLHKIANRPDFVYVADCKVCTDKQLNYITSKGGRVISIIPSTWGEVSEFKDKLRNQNISKKEILRKHISGTIDGIDYYSEFSGDHLTKKRSYKIHWIFSSEKKKRDYSNRKVALERVERKLGDLLSKINYRNLKTEKEIRSKAEEILKMGKVSNFYHISIGEVEEEETIQLGKGRPGPQTKFRTKISKIYTLSWTRKKLVLQNERKIDGIFPLLSTDLTLSGKQVLETYKYQPRLEKRFDYLKNVLLAAPLLFKKIERVDGIMFLYYLALVVSALLEREIKKSITSEGVEQLFIYPEERASKFPSTSIILDRFEDLSVCYFFRNGKIKGKFKDELSKKQKEILKYLEIKNENYWPKVL